MSDITDRLVKSAERRRDPVWKGPVVDGVTNSLLSKYLVDKERFRLLVIEGLCPQDSFSHRLEYGNMWHVCEQALASRPGLSKDTPVPSGLKGSRAPDVSLASTWAFVGDALREYARQLVKRYPLQQREVDHWYEVCKAQFPLYIRYWAENSDVRGRTPLLQEQVFEVWYTLPSRRTVKLRGKWDALDLIGSGKEAGVYLQENKSKGTVNEQQLRRQLKFDLQTMLYLVAVLEADWDANKRGPGEPLCMLSKGGFLATKGSVAVVDGTSGKKQKCTVYPVRGVRYNVVRRPLSGGKGSIVRHKPTKSNPQGESKENFYQRVAQYIRDEPETYFMRWKVEVSQEDVLKFKKQCLDPVLENLLDDYEWWAWSHSTDTYRDDESGKIDCWDSEVRRSLFPHHCPRHFRMPYGLYNPLLDDRGTDFDEYLDNGSTVGLVRAKNLFPELSPST